MKIDINKLFDANEVVIKDDVSKIDDVLEYEQILLSVSKMIIKYRKDNKLTQEDLAKTLKVNQVMISKLERGNYNPTLKFLYRMSKTLTKSSDFFINILKDIITSLYKSKNIGYTIQFKKYETYKYNLNKVKDNITYLVYEYNENDNNDNGGIVYENSDSKFSNIG